MSTQAMCWIDGNLVAGNTAQVSVFDRGFLYGDGVFEGIRFYNKRAFRLPLHLERLQRSAQALCLPIPYPLDELKQAIEATLTTTTFNDGYLRVILTRGVASMGIDPTHCERPSVIIIADQLRIMSDEQRARGAKLIIASTRKLRPDQLDARIKSLSYTHNIMAKLEARHAGADEAIMLNDRGFVAEGTVENVFVVRAGELITPPTTEGALAGITRHTLLELATAQHIPKREGVLTPYDLYTADECFLSGTGAKLVPVRSIDGRLLRTCPGPIYQQLAQAFAHLIQRETSTN